MFFMKIHIFLRKILLHQKLLLSASLCECVYIFYSIYKTLVINIPTKIHEKSEMCFVCVYINNSKNKKKTATKF